MDAMEIIVVYEKKDSKNIANFVEKRTVAFTSDKDADQWISWMQKLDRENKYKNFRKKRVA
jgi:hypothetical protein